jgi:hypothetical protein
MCADKSTPNKLPMAMPTVAPLSSSLANVNFDIFAKICIHKFSHITDQKSSASVSQLDGLREGGVVLGAPPHRIQVYVEQYRKRFGRDSGLIRQFCKVDDRGFQSIQALHL